MGIKAALAAVCGLATAASALAASPPDTQLQDTLLLLSAVKITRTRVTERAGYVMESTAYSLGTWIAPDVLLTHNHFRPALGQANEILVLECANGSELTLVPGDYAATALGIETQLVHTDLECPAGVSPLADARTLVQVDVGATVDVVVFDGEHRTLSLSAMPVLAVSAQRLKVLDAGHVIDSGNSGGGVFYNGRLVGNVSSCNVNQYDELLGTANITLLPEALMR